MKKILLALVLTLLPSLAFAQSQRNPCYYTGASPGPGNGCIPVSTANPLPVNATVNASVTGFTPNGNFATLTSAGTSGSVVLPSGATVAFQNSGSTTVSCTLGVGSATALANEIQVPASSTVFVTVGSNTWGACIDQTGSTSNTVVLAGGSGLGTGFGGGSGGGSGGSVTQGTTPWTDQGTGASGAALSGNPFRVGLSDGTNSQNWLAAIALADGVNGNNTGAMAQWYWNGTTYDRAKGDATNGAFVNVKTSVLPTGAATSVNQTSQITQETASAAALGTTADATCGTATGTCSLIALQKFANNTNPVLAAGSSVIGFTSNDPCSQATKLGAPVNLTASGQVITGTSAKKTYICSIDIVSATAQNIALVEGTGTVCATNIFGLAGGTTAATGWNLVANGGLTKGAGVGTVYSPSADTNAAAANVCLLLSGTGQTSGQITYVQQ